MVFPAGNACMNPPAWLSNPAMAGRPMGGGLARPFPEPYVSSNQPVNDPMYDRWQRSALDYKEPDVGPTFNRIPDVTPDYTRIVSEPPAVDYARILREQSERTERIAAAARESIIERAAIVRQTLAETVFQGAGKSHFSYLDTTDDLGTPLTGYHVTTDVPGLGKETGGLGVHIRDLID